MKRLIYNLAIVLFVLFGCASHKEVDNKMPFSLGQVYAQRWIIEEHPEEIGYDVIIPIRSLSTSRVSLQKLYHRGEVVDLKIELRKMGAVAVAEYPMKTWQEENEDAEYGVQLISERTRDQKGLELPFSITQRQAILTYLEDGRIKYFKIEQIRQNPIRSYPSFSFRNME